MVALAAAITLPLAGPVHADASEAASLPVSVLPVAAIAAPALTETSVSQPEYGLRTIDGGMASYYGKELAGNRTASGARFDPSALTAAHRTLPFGTQVQVTNQRTGDSVIVTINDRGPFHGNRVIDLSEAAARQIGLTGRGSGRVELAILDN
jgi:rare lipoprotein A